jgi:hypothetical protein
MQTTRSLSTSCSLWFFVAKFECKMSFCLLCVIFLFSLLLASNAALWQCIVRVMYLVWGESVNVLFEVRVWTQFEVWTFFVKCEHVKSKVLLWNRRFDVKGVRSNVWGLRSPCQVRGWRCKVQRSKVWGLYVKFEVWGQCLKCEVLCFRLEVFLCKVRSQSWTKLELWALIVLFVRFKI